MNKELRFAAALALLAVAGCSSRSTSNIDIEDRNTVVPTLRLSGDFADRHLARRSAPHTSHAYEIDLAGGRGEESIRLNAGQAPLVFGGDSFAPAQDVQARFDFRYAHLAYRYRKLFEEGLGLEGLAGVGYSRLALTLTGTTRRASERLGTGGLVLGGGVFWRFLSSTSLQVRGNYFISGDSDSVSDALRFDLQLAQALGPNVGVRGGFTTWRVRSHRESQDFSSSNNSPISLRFSGPTLGLEVMF